jgi:hypothetical protein
MDYIYRPDSMEYGPYCSRCGENPFEIFGRRESHETWLAAIEAHQTCEPEESEDGA